MGCAEGEEEAAILAAEDDDGDFLLTEKALREAGFHGPVYRVKDGEELMAFLHAEVIGGRVARERLLLLLDLNMPRKDGRVALAEIKADPELRRIPVVVLTTSTSEADVAGAYGAGASTFIRKPAGFGEFVELMRVLGAYWFKAAALPRCGSEEAAR